MSSKIVVTRFSVSEGDLKVNICLPNKTRLNGLKQQRYPRCLRRLHFVDDQPVLCEVTYLTEDCKVRPERTSTDFEDPFCFSVEIVPVATQSWQNSTWDLKWNRFPRESTSQLRVPRDLDDVKIVDWEISVLRENYKGRVWHTDEIYIVGGSYPPRCRPNVSYRICSVLGVFFTILVPYPLPQPPPSRP